MSLLAKLENEEFEPPSEIDLSEILIKNIELLSELISLSNLKLQTEISPNVMVTIHPFIAEIMINNLLGNAIKHNLKGGWIKVKLDINQLIIQNSGTSLQHDPIELIQRFKKESDKPESVGLGLAIVNQICKTYQFSFGYATDVSNHTTTIDFN